MALPLKIKQVFFAEKKSWSSPNSYVEGVSLLYGASDMVPGIRTHGALDAAPGALDVLRDRGV